MELGCLGGPLQLTKAHLDEPLESQHLQRVLLVVREQGDAARPDDGFDLAHSVARVSPLVGTLDHLAVVPELVLQFDEDISLINVIIIGRERVRLLERRPVTLGWY